MPLITVNPNRGSGRHISGPLDVNKSNETIVLAATAAILPAGLVLGRVTVGALTGTAGAPVSGTGAAPGNGSVGAVTVDPGTAAGVYQVRFTDPTHYEVLLPSGAIEGNGVLGAPYNGSVNFAGGAAGGTPFVEDDRIPVTVAAAAGSGSYAPWDPDALDGSQVAAGILWHDAPISAGTQKNVATVRDGVVNGNLLSWKAGVDAADKAAAAAQLAINGLIIRQ